MNYLKSGVFFCLLLIYSSVLNAQTYNYYFGNLHSHTGYSDGDNTTTPTQAYTYAKSSLNFHFLGISEHNHSGAGMSKPDYASGIAQANSSNVNGTFVCLYGMEWGVINNGGHLLVYGFDSLIGWESGNYDIFVDKFDYASLFLKISQKQGAFATLAHPGGSDYSNLTGTAYNATRDAAIVGTAIRNGPSTSTNTTYTNPSTSNAESYYKNLLKLGYHVSPQIDHDNHKITFGRHTPGRTVVLATSLTKANILDALKNGRFYASDDWNCKVNFTIYNSPMGSSVSSGGNAPLVVTVTDPDGESVASIEILSGVPGSGSTATSLTSNAGSASLNYTASVSNLASKYFYAKITQSDGDVIWTAPIWYTRNDALPVELIDFTGKYEYKNVTLKWSTASEENNNYFSIERASNGNDFEEIGRVNGNGNAMEIHNYVFRDMNPVDGVNYYRLKQIDFDGVSELSNVISVNTSKEELDIMKIAIHPGSMSIDLYYPDYTEAVIELFDLSGKMIFSNRINAIKGYHSFSVTVPELNKGIYLMRIHNGHFSVTKKLIF